MHEPSYSRDSRIEARARALYSDTLPYHNFAHIEDTLAAANTIIERCRAEHIRIDTAVIYYALLFHDAGYHEDHRRLGFATKERYSAELATGVLREFNVAAEQIRKTVGAIIATERDATFLSAEQKAVRAADLAGLAAPYPQFLGSSLKLMREHELLNHTTLSWSQWQQISQQVLGFYLTQEIRLTSYFHDDAGESAYHRAVRENLFRLQAEPFRPLPP